jgi:hypothetical protein
MKRVSSLLLYIALLVFAVASLPAQNVTGKGTPGTIPIWTGTNTIGDSIITQTGSTVTAKGSVVGSSASSFGVTGTSTNTFGVQGISTNHYGVYGLSTNAIGVEGVGKKVGVEGESTDGKGVDGESDTGTAVEGNAPHGTGVLGASTSGVGVEGFSTSAAGVQGSSRTYDGVLGISENYRGVEGQSNVKAAVAGISTSGDGIGGVSCASCTTAAAVYGMGQIAGSFVGNVEISQNLVVQGYKQFHIDHPLDPANMYLNHFAIESNEVLNTYSGNAITDMGGLASVKLPRYFQALNTNYRYQLTVIGEFAQAIIFQEIQNNRFVIKTDKPSVKVSWQVTGVRSDVYARTHTVPVEQQKPARERGHYITPKLFGQPEEKSLAWLYHSDFVRDAKAVEAKRKALGLSTKQP